MIFVSFSRILNGRLDETKVSRQESVIRKNNNRIVGAAVSDRYPREIHIFWCCSSPLTMRRVLYIFL